eukprot:CAMPEP_0171335436 /NCGR_PEP_ID=MMETSP0878-20121228/5334_1 /TAXON_ID=67004 /ORGANISM="Thalassiosira weissflogii, Strain CCMP1336" /LENGTH=566 /DNA_ID=CAMNT_0011836705 /DNA_START=77 /DNA_END=1777 /DNA_ORIENTATION=-
MDASGESPRNAYLYSLGIPRGLISSVIQNVEQCDMRLWLLDNSSAMSTRDSHRIGGSWEKIEKLDGATRWEELMDCVAFHADMTAKCWIPTKFCLVNDPQNEMTPQKFNLCCNTPNEISSELNQIRRTMTRSTANLSQHPRNPLVQHIRNIQNYIVREAPRLVSQGKYINFVICTQGLPTDEQGHSGPAFISEFRQAILSLSKLPVKTVIRLCTDDERVVDFYNTLDGQLTSLDVLDDYWGEALEVYLHNPWLTYGMGLHRLREAGLAWNLVDCIDERPLSVGEIYEFCKFFFLGGNGANLPDPCWNWNEFYGALTKLLSKEKPQWNPVAGALMPWIDLAKLNSIYGRMRQQPQPQFSVPGQFVPPYSTSTNSHQQQFTPNNNINHPSMQQTQYQHGQQQSGVEHPYSTNPLPTQQPKSTTQPNAQTPPQSFPSIPNTINSNMSHPNTNSIPLKQQILQNWALQPPQYRNLNPLPQLLVTVPTTFPPSTKDVEPHDYFGKWKPFSMDAFGVGDGGPKIEVLKRAVRKAKFFLHPDKLPKDLTENQAILFKTLWDVIRDSWDVMEGK